MDEWNLKMNVAISADEAAENLGYAINSMIASLLNMTTTITSLVGEKNFINFVMPLIAVAVDEESQKIHREMAAKNMKVVKERRSE